jgi:hypothetical protein
MGKLTDPRGVVLTSWQARSGEQRLVRPLLERRSRAGRRPSAPGMNDDMAALVTSTAPGPSVR